VFLCQQLLYLPELSTKESINACQYLLPKNCGRELSGANLFYYIFIFFFLFTGTSTTSTKTETSARGTNLDTTSLLTTFTIFYFLYKLYNFIFYNCYLNILRHVGINYKNLTSVSSPFHAVVIFVEIMIKMRSNQVDSR